MVSHVRGDGLVVESCECGRRSCGESCERRRSCGGVM